MEGIMALQASETRLFKQGSGTGTNFSSLRSSYEPLSGGGFASGPVSFMEGFDANAGATKSGGTTRRAAKMVILDIDHPDVLEQKNGKAGFIRCKAEEEQTAHDLYETGKYSAEWNKPGNVYERVKFQNANNSVSVPDEFMHAVEDDAKWQTIAVKGWAVINTYRARELYAEIVKAAWKCGDPGMHFNTAMNFWNTCKKSGEINASNPCSEFLFLDSSACNLGSFNLMAFVRGQEFMVPEFKHAINTAVTAQEILVEASSYPSKEIEENSHRFRPLGVGYTNLGALLTYWGLPYDSNKGRNTTAAITAIMTGEAYCQSARLASALGPFPAFSINKESMMEVIQHHFDAAKRLTSISNEYRRILVDNAFDVWKEAKDLGEEYGYRNAQTTLLAPTGTISFLMGAWTTGIEPMLGCVTYKKLVGEGVLVLPNGVVGPALHNLGYQRDVVTTILEHLKRPGASIHDAPGFDERAHGAIFAEALGPHAIAPEGHVDMMVVVQPFLSGSISKTVNMAATCTPEDISKVYLRAWKNGLKCIAVFRDGCKLTQPISTSNKKEVKVKALFWGDRKRMDQSRVSITHKFSIQGQELYIHVGLWPDWTFGEIFIRSAKEGSTLSGILDCWATAVSIALQHGAPPSTLIDKYQGQKFEPSGMTDNPEINKAWSIPDYIFTWIEKGLPREIAKLRGLELQEQQAQPKPSAGLDGPPCPKCGNFTRASGHCYVCNTCGETTGCG
jgi:ribonucleoside-diphosphate reductase alpha chain